MVLQILLARLVPKRYSSLSYTTSVNPNKSASSSKTLCHCLNSCASVGAALFSLLSIKRSNPYNKTLENKPERLLRRYQNQWLPIRRQQSGLQRRIGADTFIHIDKNQVSKL